MNWDVTKTAGRVPKFSAGDDHIFEMLESYQAQILRAALRSSVSVRGTDGHAYVFVDGEEPGKPSAEDQSATRNEHKITDL